MKIVFERKLASSVNVMEKGICEIKVKICFQSTTIVTATVNHHLKITSPYLLRGLQLNRGM